MKRRASRASTPVGSVTMTARASMRPSLQSMRSSGPDQSMAGNRAVQPDGQAGSACRHHGAKAFAHRPSCDLNPHNARDPAWTPGGFPLPLPRSSLHRSGRGSRRQAGHRRANITASGSSGFDQGMVVLVSRRVRSRVPTLWEGGPPMPATGPQPGSLRSTREASFRGDPGPCVFLGKVQPRRTHIGRKAQRLSGHSRPPTRLRASSTSTRWPAATRAARCRNACSACAHDDCIEAAHCLILSGSPYPAGAC